MYDYVLLYSGTISPTDTAGRDKSMKEWNDWFKKINNSVVDQGNPFLPKAKSISGDGKIIEGTHCPTVTGYSIIKAISLDAAIQLAKGCPALRNGAKVSVYETMNAM